VSLPVRRLNAAPSPLSLPPFPVAVICLLMLASTVVWRRGDIFSGSIDPVVLAKAVLSVAALCLAFLNAVAGGPGRWRRLGTGSLWFLAVLVGASVFGALTYGTLVPSAVVAVRVVIVALTVFLLLKAAAPAHVFSGLVWSSGAIALVAAATNPGSAGTGRLEGGIPPLNPNEMALLAGIVVLAVVWRIVLGETAWYLWGAAVLFLAIIWLTGSRTALLMLVAAIAVMAAHMRRPSPVLVVGALCAAAAGVVGVAATGAVTSFLERDGAGTSTLSSRFIAWTAARSWAETGWQMAFGGGLSVKLIPVRGQWWESALVQAGAVGLVTAGLWSLWVVRGALHVTRPYRILFLGLLVFLLGRSVLESGLFDATPAFLLFMFVSLLAEGRSRARLEPLVPRDTGTAPAGRERAAAQA
jgi:O-antigen ligase